MKNILRTLHAKWGDIQEIRERYESRKNKKKEKDITVLPEGSLAKDVVEVRVSVGTVAKILFCILVFWILVQVFFVLKSLVVIIAISLFLTMGLSSVVSAIERWHIPRPLAILILYVIFFGALSVVFAGIVPIVIKQMISIVNEIQHFIASFDVETASIPHFVERILDLAGVEIEEALFFVGQMTNEFAQSLQEFKNWQGLAGSTLGVVSTIFQSVFNFVFTLILLFFILMEREAIGKFFLLLLPKRDRKYFAEKSSVIQHKMGLWVRGQAILMLSVGLFMYLGMKIFEYFFGMQYALTIALVAGFMELFPYIGVFTVGVLACLVAINISWILALAVLGWICLTQFLEGNLLVPVVMEKVTGLPSVAVILAMATAGMVGKAFGGVPFMIVCMILAVPVTASIAIFVEEYMNRSEPKKKA